VSDNVERRFETDIHTYIHTCIHTYIRTYLHTHIHTYVDTECALQAVSWKGGSFFCAVKQTERVAKQSSVSSTGVKNASR